MNDEQVAFAVEIVRRALAMRCHVYVRFKDTEFHDVPTYCSIAPSLAFDCSELVVHGQSGAIASFQLTEGLYVKGPL